MLRLGGGPSGAKMPSELPFGGGGIRPLVHEDGELGEEACSGSGCVLGSLAPPCGG